MICICTLCRGFILLHILCAATLTDMSNMRNTAGLIGKVADDDAPQFEGGLDDHVVQSAEPVLVEGGAAASRELQQVCV